MIQLLAVLGWVIGFDKKVRSIKLILCKNLRNETDMGLIQGWAKPVEVVGLIIDLRHRALEGA